MAELLNISLLEEDVRHYMNNNDIREFSFDENNPFEQLVESYKLVREFIPDYDKILPELEEIDGESFEQTYYRNEDAIIKFI